MKLHMKTGPRKYKETALPASLRYFEAHDKLVQIALETLKQLSASEISIELPNLNQSLSAIRNFKAGKERK